MKIRILLLAITLTSAIIGKSQINDKKIPDSVKNIAKAIVGEEQYKYSVWYTTSAMSVGEGMINHSYSIYVLNYRHKGLVDILTFNRDDKPYKRRTKNPFSFPESVKKAIIKDFPKLSKPKKMRRKVIKYEYYYPKHSEFYSIKKGNKEFIYTKEGKRLLNEDSISMVEVAIYHRGVIPTGEE